MDFPFDRLHSQTRGFCYVEFSTPEEAENAMKHMDGGQIDGQEITCAPVLMPRVQRKSPMRLPPPRWDRRRDMQQRYRRPRSPVRRRSPPRAKRPRSRSPRKRRYSRSSSSSSH